MVEVRDVTRTYGSGPTATSALRGVTFSIGEGQLVVAEPHALGAEEDAAALPFGTPRPELGRGALGRGDRLHHLPRPGARGVKRMQIGRGRLHAREELSRPDHLIGTGSRRLGLGIGPAVAGPYQAQIREAAIEHGARGKADVLAELRLDENDRRPPEPAQLGALRPVGAGHCSECGATAPSRKSL